MGRSRVELSTKVVVDLTEKTPIRVLHVDDEAGFLKTAKPCLEMHGAFQVDTASSVEEAEEKMKHRSYDVIVSDYVMPGKNGLEFLKELRESGNNIPFIIFTGRGREIVAIKALNFGADLYVNKIGNPEVVYRELAHGMRKLVEAKRAEETLRESEEFSRSLIRSISPDGLMVIGEGRTIVECNEAVKNIFGYSRDELIGKKTAILFPDRQSFEEYGKEMYASIREQGYHIGEVRGKKRNGEELAVEVSCASTKDKLGVVAIVRDITEKKKKEEELRRSEEKYRNLFDNARDLILTTDLEGKITSVNNIVREYGFDKTEFTGRNLFDFLPRVYRKQFTNQYQQLAQGKPVEGEFEMEFKGRQGCAEYKANPMVRDDKVVGIQAIVRDITEREKTEKATRESMQKFEGLFRDNPEGAVYLDSHFHILDTNPRFTELFGYSLDEMKGKRLLDEIVPQEKMEEGKMLDKKAQEGYVYYDTVRKRKDGSLVPVAISAAPITVKGELIGYVGLYKDITQRKKAERELEESREHFRTLFNVMVDPVVIVDGNGKFLEVTDRVMEITGYKKEELVEKNFLRSKIVTAKSKAVLMKNLAKRMVGMHVTPYTVELLTKDGRKLPYEVNAEKIMYKGQAADMVVFRDVSERKRMEEKLRVLGVLTRHDVRNKLSAIAGNVYLARKKLPENHEVLKHLNEIESALGQAMRIFDFAKTYEKLSTEELRYMDVAETFEEAVSLFSGLEDVKVINYCQGLTVIADSLLRQLFFNLIHNSLQHGEKVNQIGVHYEETGKKELKLVYEDNGVGIPKAEKEKIFKEGYGKGTGYGLHLIRKMCEVYGWTIRETGKHGKGAQFTITITKTGKNGKTSYQLSRNSTRARKS